MSLLEQYQGAFANVFVPADAPAYEAMRMWAAGADIDPREWKMSGTDHTDAKYERSRPGIWVTLTAFNEHGRRVPRLMQSIGEALAAAGFAAREAAGAKAPEAAP